MRAQPSRRCAGGTKVSDRPAPQNDLRRLFAAVPIVNGQLTTQSKLGTFGVILEVTMPTAGTEVVIEHPLTRVPNGYWVIRSASGGTLYDPVDGAARWSTKQMILRGTVSGDVVSLLVL